MVDEKELIARAYEAQKKAYTPYSHWQVGAALLAKNGKIYTGCNIENSAFSPTICAERVAFVKAVSEGIKEFKAIAVVGNYEGVKPGDGNFCAPCGVCRQVMREFCNPKEFQVILANGMEYYRVFLLDDLFPLGFGPENLL